MRPTRYPGGGDRDPDLGNRRAGGTLPTDPRAGSTVKDAPVLISAPVTHCRNERFRMFGPQKSLPMSVSLARERSWPRSKTAGAVRLVPLAARNPAEHGVPRRCHRGPQEADGILVHASPRAPPLRLHDPARFGTKAEARESSSGTARRCDPTAVTVGSGRRSAVRCAVLNALFRSGRRRLSPRSND